VILHPNKIDRRGAVLAALAAAVMLVSCNWQETTIYRYRLIVKVRKGARTYQGISVVEIQNTGPSQPSSMMGVSIKYRGEAVAIDFGWGELLFALLNNDKFGEDWAPTIAHIVFEQALGTRSMTDRNALRKLQNMTGAEGVLPPSLYPIFVHFEKINDPQTAQILNVGNASEVFGSDFSVESVIIRMTSDDPQFVISKRFSWWEKYKNLWFNGKSRRYRDLTDSSPLSRLTSSSFSTELDQ
jgi:hypothetical protein